MSNISDLSKNKNVQEVILVTTSMGELWNCCVWDLHTGTIVTTYKGETACPRTLDIIGKEYLISAIKNKPLLYVWELQSKNQKLTRMVCPGVISALAISPRSEAYCVAGIEEKIYVWQVNTGNLLAILSRHFQKISVIKFTDCSSYFITAGEDNLILVWKLSRVINFDYDERSSEPVYTWAGHSLPITNIHVGIGGHRSRVFSASLDQSCKIWDIKSGQLLFSFIFETPLMSVVTDVLESRLFTGGTDGNIYQINLIQALQAAPHKEINFQSTTEDLTKLNIFKSHSKQVTCLSLSMDGTILLSGSDDFTLKLWHIESQQCIKTMNYKGPITNAMIAYKPLLMSSSGGKPTVPFHPFSHQLYVIPNQELNVLDEDGFKKENCIPLVPGKKHKSDSNEESEEMAHLRLINRELFIHVSKSLLQNDVTDENNC